MKKVILLLFILIQFLNASIFDFQTLDEAKNAYESGNYEKAAKLYAKIAKEGNDEAKFNAADALYKAGKFQEALTLFKSISSKNLQFEKLHNMGNCYANLKKFDDAINMYEAALKIREDKDTRFNLELLKKLKKQNQQNKKQSQNSKDKNSKQNSDQNKKGDQKNRSNKQNQNQKNNKKDQQKDKKEKSEQNKKEKQEKKKSDSKRDEKKEQNRRVIKKDEPISDMEVRKWNKVLNQRGIHTLMLPLQTENKGADNEKHPW
ncbi:tetratricopeptide repeat protein [Hydrogenimonas thermophila]|uniref:Ca-activated chloride channel family protein n=1 Tax=Hydrogenimonas thermophila TaxID=223786 RepID=A0A1I5QZG9_9BACT|nr:tetratricopeptide repeat protein [Hydrogenimonas thermophila]SFP51196.1 Ca-activated chloride channel family protein [Hydrogenimonas thermophila]